MGEPVLTSLSRAGLPVPDGPVEAESSGLLFTVDPVTGADGVVVHAGWGLVETVADGSITPDTYVVGGRAPRREIGDKAVRRVLRRGGTVVEPVPDGLRHQPVLTEAQAAELAALGARVHELVGPSDVEWVRHAGGFAFLSVRPLVVGAPPSTVEFVAIVLAGGAGSRLGGVDKPGLVVAGRTLLDRALAAVGGARAVVVGPERGSARPVQWTREDPPGGGPVAGLRAGLDAVSDVPDHAVAVLLAADLPSVDRAVVTRLVAEVGESGAVLVDGGGREQWLLSAWRLGVLRGAVPAGGAGMSLRGVLGGLAAARVVDTTGAAEDIDTPEDLRRFRG